MLLNEITRNSHQNLTSVSANRPLNNSAQGRGASFSKVPVMFRALYLLCLHSRSKFQ